MFVMTVLMPSTASGESDPPPSLTMNMALNASADGGYFLEVVLSNHGKEAISVSALRLPWAPDNWHLWIKGIRLGRKHTQLRSGAAMIDYGGQVNILPGEQARGSVPLHGMFRSLAEDIRQHAVRIELRCPKDLLPIKCPNEVTKYILSNEGIRNISAKDR